MDPAHRYRAVTAETETDGSWSNATTTLNHYGDDSDKPRWIVEDTATGVVTRNVCGPDGDLAASTSTNGEVNLHLTNLHGDVAATINLALTDPELFDYDEFGTPSSAQADQRYGWLGGKQRSGDALGGVLLMGVRLYLPSTGRFLSTDPMAGGSCNAYEYVCGDPVNSFDLDGRCRTIRWTWNASCRPSGSYREALHAHISLAAWFIPGGSFYKGGRYGIRVGKAGWKVGKRAARIGWKGCRSNWRKCGSSVIGEGYKTGFAATIGGDWDNLKTAGRFWRDRTHDWGARGYNGMCAKLNQWTRGLSRSSCRGVSYRRNWAW